MVTHHSMRGSLFLVLLALLSCLKICVYASPTTNFVKRAIDTGAALDSKMITAPDTTLFWYGHSGGSTVHTPARTYATDNSLETIQQYMFRKRILEGNTPEWMVEASISFSKGASGKVHVYVGQTAESPQGSFENSVWWKHELPALTRPGRVTEIIEILAAAPKKTKALWKAGQQQMGNGFTTPYQGPISFPDSFSTASVSFSHGWENKEQVGFRKFPPIK